MDPITQSHKAEGRLDMRESLSSCQLAQQERQFHILSGRQYRNEIVELEHETDVPGAPSGEIRFLLLGDREAGRVNGTLSWAV